MPLRWKLILLFFPLLTATGSLAACGQHANHKVQLKVYHADSLIIPFQAIEKDFEIKYPNIDVMLEAHGSIQVVRSVTELSQEVDAAAVADYQLIPMLMYQTRMPDKNDPYADWYIKFATNKIGIAYTADSLFSSEINKANWYQIFSRPDVRVGLADPVIDSLGYRALMVIQLAREYYKDDTIFQKLIIDNFSRGFTVTGDTTNTTITIPLLVKPTQDKISLRSYNLQLLALLESNNIDYIFEYESVARQHNLKFLELPPSIDLSSREYIDNYRRVTVDITFQRFASVSPKFEGSQIIYGITIPQNALHPREAAEFIKYILGDEGQRIFSENYQPPLSPAQADDRTRVPETLKAMLD